MEMNEKRLLVAKHKQQLFNYLIDRYVFCIMNTKTLICTCLLNSVCTSGN
jgi:hypothetical protein